jgi:hypothetical protein
MRGERKEEEKESGWGIEKSRKNKVEWKKNGIKESRVEEKCNIKKKLEKKKKEKRRGWVGVWEKVGV